MVSVHLALVTLCAFDVPADAQLCVVMPEIQHSKDKVSAVCEQDGLIGELAVVGNLASLQRVTVRYMEDTGLLDLTLEVGTRCSIMQQCSRCMPMVLRGPKAELSTGP